MTENKAASILMRVSDADKERLRAAAAKVGKSVTTFVLEAAAKEAARVEKREPARGVHGGVPSFFRGCCAEAARGGTGGYANAGWHLANGLGSLAPHDLDLDEWADEIEKLQDMLSNDDGDGALAWFGRHYPKCIALVPQRRRHQFLEGVQRAHEEERISA